MDDAEIRRRVIDYRMKYRLTQKEAADRIGVSVPTIHKIENEKKVSILIKAKIVRFFSDLDKES